MCMVETKSPFRWITSRLSPYSRNYWMGRPWGFSAGCSCVKDTTWKVCTTRVQRCTWLMLWAGPICQWQWQMAIRGEHLYNHVSTCHGWTTTANQTCNIGRSSALPAEWSDPGWLGWREEVCAARCAAIPALSWWANCGRPAYIQGSPDCNSGMHEKGTDGSYTRKPCGYRGNIYSGAYLSLKS